MLLPACPGQLAQYPGVLRGDPPPTARLVTLCSIGYSGSRPRLDSWLRVLLLGAGSKYRSEPQLTRLGLVGGRPHGVLSTVRFSQSRRPPQYILECLQSAAVGVGQSDRRFL